MKFYFLFGLGLLAGVVPGMAGEKSQEESPAAVEAVAEKPSLKQLLEARLGDTEVKTPRFTTGVSMAISANDERVQQYVLDGLTCLHAGWDFEAFRQFSVAILQDPQCLMAHWGATLALFHGNADLAEIRDAIFERLLTLTEAGVGTDLERRYVFALVKLIREGAGEAAAAFQAAAQEYPNDPQLVVLWSLLSRGGYDEDGIAKPDEERVQDRIRELIKKHPEAEYLKLVFLLLRAEAADLSADLEMARELCEESPEFAPYQHVLGHYEWRNGNFARAQEAFLQTTELYRSWMQKGEYDYTDCPGWTRSEAYRAVSLASRGEYESALAIAEGLRRLSVDKDQALKDGGRMVLWEAKTLPMRLLLRRDKKGDMDLAKAQFPNPDEVKEIGDNSLAVWNLQALSTFVLARYALEEGKRDDGLALSGELLKQGQQFAATRNEAIANDEASFWARTFRGMEVIASELKGIIALTGEKENRGGAFNWFRSATDRQVQASMLMPPNVLLPMEVRLTDYFLGEGKENSLERALSTVREGLKRWPNDYELLQKYLEVAKAMKDAELINDVEDRLEKLKK